MKARFALTLSLLVGIGLPGPALTVQAQYTLLKIFSPPCPFPTGVLTLETRGELYVYCAFDPDVHVLNLAGDSVAVFNPGFSDDGFRHTDMVTDAEGQILMLRDLRPGRRGPGAEIWRLDPETRTGTFLLDLDPLTSGEPYGLALHPENGNLLIGESFGAPGHVLEITRNGTLVDTVLTANAINALGLDVDAGDLQVYTPTGELVIGGWSGTPPGILYTVDLSTGGAEAFFDTGITTAEAGPTGITFCAGGDMALVTQHDVRLYDLDEEGDGAFCGAVVNTSTARGTDTPGAFQLTAAYPNPFRAETRFDLRVEQQETVRVTVFNALGKAVHEVFHGRMAPGTARTLAFDAAGLPAGVYFIRVAGETFAASRPVFLMR